MQDTVEKVPDSEIHACKALQPLHLHLQIPESSLCSTRNLWLQHMGSFLSSMWDLVGNRKCRILVTRPPGKSQGDFFWLISHIRWNVLICYWKKQCTPSGRKWTWSRRVSASRPSTSGGGTVSTILVYSRSPSLMTRPPASMSGITGTLSSWNLKTLQINQVRARPVVSSGVKGTASCQHRPHRTAPGTLLVSVVWDSLGLLLFFIMKYV